MYKYTYQSKALSWIAPALLALSCGMILAGCGKKAPIEETQVARPVKVVQLVSSEIESVIALPGQISPLSQADMAFEVSGVMIEMLVTEGQEVKTGQLLARLDPRDYVAMRDSAQAQLENAAIEASRAQALYERQAASKQRVDIATSNLKVAKAAFDKAEKAYQDTFLRAPISGIVARKLVEDVVNVQAKQVILIIQDNSQLKAVVDIPETLGSTARIGLSLAERTAFLKPKVTLSFLPGRSFPATIAEVSMMADPTTRTYQATFLFEPPSDVVILPGMTAKVEVSIDRSSRTGKKTFTVPVQSVAFDNQGSPYVWTVAHPGMTVHKRPVSVGQVAGSEIEINSEALQNGDHVVTSGVQTLVEGTPVSLYER